MQFSHSRVECYKNCPFKYKLRYINELKVLPEFDAKDNLIIGSTLHEAIEKGYKKAEEEYLKQYPVITDEHIEELVKIEYFSEKIREVIDDQNIFEFKIQTNDFIGFIDLLIKNEDGIYDIYDFKYSNNVEKYLESTQLHLYKYFFEKMTGNKVSDLYFIFIPKITIRPKKIKGTDRKEDVFEFRKRLREELKNSNLKVEKVEYNPNKVIEYLEDIKHILEENTYLKNETKLCDWCEYEEYCKKGEEYMILPKNERRNINLIERKKIWIYGAPFSGKTYLANKFPSPLMLNTDGNIRFIDAPFIPIKDEVMVEGRITKRKSAWEVFIEVIEELEKKQNDFKTIVVDLLEDTYEHCRAYIFNREGYTHETDGGFGKGWDLVKTEFLNVIKRLTNLEYENIILISHEDLSKDLTKKTGDKVTSIRPNLSEKMANKVAGMVDIVARVVADDNVRTLNFKNDELIFGGGRLSVDINSIPLEYEELMKVYEKVNVNLVVPTSNDQVLPDNNNNKNNTEEVIEEEKPKRTRKTRKGDE